MTGWGGLDCMTACPTAPSGTVCGGPAQGSCSEVTGECVCYSGWGGLTCSESCPAVGGVPCNSQGECAGDPPTCKCNSGWGGEDCSIECPCVNGVCSLGGQCVCRGNWGGAECGTCAVGWSGTDCEIVCMPPNGTTSGTTCECGEGRSGLGCASICPQDQSQVCSGHGKCLSGSSLARSNCKCEEGWFALDCGVQCDAVRDCPELLHPQCSLQTGRCECQANASGTWAGDDCAKCAEEWWGPYCNRACDCENGKCAALDGTCSCYSDAKRGWWTGRSCDACASGYTGEGCRQKESPFTRSGSRGTAVYSTSPPRVLICSPKTNETYVGSYRGGITAVSGMSFPGTVAVPLVWGWRVEDARLIVAAGTPPALYAWSRGQLPTKIAGGDIGLRVSGGCPGIIVGEDCSTRTVSHAGAVAVGESVPVLLSCPIVCCSEARQVVCGPTAQGWSCVELGKGEIDSSGLQDGGKVGACAIDEIQGLVLVLIGGLNLILARIPVVGAAGNLSAGTTTPLLVSAAKADPDEVRMAVAAHPLSTVAYVFWQTRADEPSSMAKFQTSGVGGQYGKSRLGRRPLPTGTLPEVAGAACISGLFLTAAVSGVAEGALSFLSYEGLSVYPAVADARGGTE
eukprot:Hpha_TRINITY_DN6682_c0_g2::TRINITY_DN6682_c0_g2_i1::g.26532::m.26532